MKENEIKEMRVLGITQPWAHCIIHNGKNVENRTWPNRPYFFHRGTFAVHASRLKSKKESQELCDECKKCYGIKINPEDLAYGAIIGFAEVVDVITKKGVTTKTKKWFQGEQGFVLSNMVALKKPVKTRGKQGFWKLTGRPLKACLEQLTATQKNKFREFKKLEE